MPTTGTKFSALQKTIPNGDSSDSEDDTSEDEKPKVQQANSVLQPSADSSAEESSSASEDSDSDTSPKTPVVASKKAQPAKGSSSDTESSSSEESSSSGSEDIEMEDRSPAVVSTGRLMVAFIILKLKLMSCFRETKGRG